MAMAGTDEPVERWPAEQDRIIELVREAFIHAMRDEGISPRIRFRISARAELKIREALEYDAEDAERERASNRQLALAVGGALL